MTPCLRTGWDFCQDGANEPWLLTCRKFLTFEQAGTDFFENIFASNFWVLQEPFPSRKFHCQVFPQVTEFADLRRFLTWVSKVWESPVWWVLLAWGCLQLLRFPILFCSIQIEDCSWADWPFGAHFQAGWLFLEGVGCFDLIALNCWKVVEIDKNWWDFISKSFYSFPCWRFLFPGWVSASVPVSIFSVSRFLRMLFVIFTVL